MSFAASQPSESVTRQTFQTGGLNAKDSGAAPDRRKHRRVSVALLGRFMRANKQEFPCRLRDISIGGASVIAPVPLEKGEFVIAYFDSIGGLRGEVVRVFNGGFAMKLQATQHKREKLAADLTWLINKEAFGTIEERRHERVATANQFATLALTDEFSTKCQILDISMSGASLSTTARPEIGAEVKVGKQRAIVRRHHSSGIGVQFLDIQDPGTLKQFEG